MQNTGLKTLFFLAANLTILCSASAKTWLLPSIEFVQINNSKTQASEMYLQSKDDEDSFIINAGSKIEREISSEHLYLQSSDLLQVSYLNQIISEGRSNNLELTQPKSGLGTLTIRNLSPIDQEGLIRFFNPLQRQEAVSFQIPQFESKTFSLPVGGRIQVYSNGSINAVWKVNNSVQILKYKQNWKNYETAPKTARFVVSNNDDTMSFIVELTDPNLIKQAREQINNPNKFLPRIVVAEIAKNKESNNFNYSSRWKNPWSWNVSKVYRFADIGSQFCNGNPEFLEEYLDSWIESGRNICFWNYRITAEL